MGLTNEESQAETMHEQQSNKTFPRKNDRNHGYNSSPNQWQKRGFENDQRGKFEGKNRNYKNEKFAEDFNDYSSQQQDAKRFRRNDGDSYSTSANQMPLGISRETIDYFEQIAANLDQDENATEDSLRALTDRIFEEIDDNSLDEISLCSHPTVSEFLPKIFRFPEAATKILERIFKQKRKRIIGELLVSSSGSKVFEHFLDRIQTDFAKNFAILREIFELLIENYDQLASNWFSVHVLEAFGRCLAGVKVLKSQGKKNDEILPEKLIANVPEEISDLLLQMTTRVLDWNSHKDYLQEETVSLLIQEFIRLDVLMQFGVLEKFIDVALGTETQINIIHSMCDKQASRIWEAAIRHSNEKMIEKFYEKIFKENLLRLICDRFGNFPAQKFIEKISDEEMFSSVRKIFVENLQKIMAKKFFGVFTAFISAGSKFESEKKKVVKAIFSAFDCCEKEKEKEKEEKSENRKLASVPCILQLKKFDEIPRGEDGKILITSQNYHGSLILQALLNYPKPHGITESLLNLSPDQLLAVSRHQCGSHVLCRFFASETVKMASKLALISTLKPHLVQLVSDQYGSWIFEEIWSQISWDLRTEIVAELMRKEAAVSGNRWGKLIYSKFVMQFFKKSPKVWLEKCKALEKKNDS